MSKRSAGDEESDIASKKVKRDGDASDSAPKESASQLEKDSEGNYYLDLGNMKRATVNVFKGAAQINIREYFTDKNGDLKPGRKGITLNRTQWDLFLSGIDTLNEKLKTVDTEKSEKKTVEKIPKKKKEEKAPKKTKKKKKAESEDEGSDEE